MKILDLEAFLCPAGWRNWAFIKITTYEGIVGYADCTEVYGSQAGVLAVIEELKPLILGRDPRHLEWIYKDLYRLTRQSAKGVVEKALAAIENALLDIKARALNIPVYELLGGPTRESIPLYWSHCGSNRIRSLKYLNQVAPINNLRDISALGKEVLSQGFTALKTNLLLFPEVGSPQVLMQGYKGGSGTLDRNLTRKMLSQIEKMLGTFRDAVGPETDLMLDANMHFRLDGHCELARCLAPFNLTWLEVDVDDPATLKQVRDSARMPIASCEQVQGLSGYRAYLEARAVDIALIDMRWCGVWQAKKIADLAESYEVNVAPHNDGSPLSTLMAAHFCAAISNLKIMEYEVDDVPWRDVVLTKPLDVRNGALHLSSDPGWGADLNETFIKGEALAYGS